MSTKKMAAKPKKSSALTSNSLRHTPLRLTDPNHK